MGYSAYISADIVIRNHRQKGEIWLLWQVSFAFLDLTIISDREFTYGERKKDYLL